jgi:hypothetical protein
MELSKDSHAHRLGSGVEVLYRRRGGPQVPSTELVIAGAEMRCTTTEIDQRTFEHVVESCTMRINESAYALVEQLASPDIWRVTMTEGVRLGCGTRVTFAILEGEHRLQRTFDEPLQGLLEAAEQTADELCAEIRRHGVCHVQRHS